MSASFLSLDNLMHCEERFRTFLQARTQNGGRTAVLDDDRDKPGRLRRTLYYAMRRVAADAGSSQKPIRVLNNATLNAVLDEMLAVQSNSSFPPLPAAHAETQMHARDRDVYGERHVRMSPIPAPMQGGGGSSRTDAAEAMALAFQSAKLQRSYDSDVAGGPLPPPPPPAAPSPKTEEPMNTSDFEQRLADMEMDRRSPGMMLGPVPSADSLVVTRASQQEVDAFRAAASATQQLTQHLGVGIDARQHTFIPQPTAAMTVAASVNSSSIELQTRYVTLSGADRDVAANPQRYQFSCKVGGGVQTPASLQGTYRDVSWLEATRVVLPTEIVAAKGSVIAPKGFYNVEFSFAFPYLVLLIDDFDGLYDGTNELLRRAFCVFMYDRHYNAPNGRGYVMLKPAQQERKHFRTPLASLRELSVSLVRPNGTLFNNSADSYTVSFLEYDPAKRLFLKCVLDQYYDRNELFVGDIVRIVGFVVAPRDPTQAATAYAHGRLNTFLNRVEGHEVVQLAQTNDQGFVNAFYILAPGLLDQANGRVVVDADTIAVVGSMAPSSPRPVASSTSRCRPS